MGEHLIGGQMKRGELESASKHPYLDLNKAGTVGRISGPLLMLGTLVLIEVLSRTLVKVPTPGAIMLTVIVYTAFIGGLRSAMISVSMALLYSVYYFSIPGQLFQYTEDNLVRLITLTIAAPAIGIMVGMLRKRAEQLSEEALRQERDYSDSLMTAMQDGLVVIGPDGRHTYVNPSFCEMTGFSREELLGKRLPPPYCANEIEVMEEVLQGAVRGGSGDHEVLFRRKNGECFPVIISAACLCNEAGDPTVIFAVVKDITERKRAEEALREHGEQLRDFFDNANDLIQSVDLEGRFLYVNRAWLRTLGYREEELPNISLFDIIHPSERAHCMEAFQRAMRGEQLTNVEATFVARDGRSIQVEGNVNVRLAEGKVPITRSIFRDITERKTLERELEHQTFHDLLTGLPNRALFMDRLELALARADRHGRSIALLFLDLDNFKVINDSMGHSAGDRLLRMVGERLEGCLRAGDTLSRFGGDEFAILLEDTSSADEASQVAERIMNALKVPFVLGRQEVFVTASIGVALSTPGQRMTEELLRDADTAMYRAKNKGKAQYEVFVPSMYARAVDRLKMDSDLRRAIERGELRVYYQPIVSLKDGGIVAVEALARWQHPDRGLVYPLEFISLAEETGLIIPLGQWVLEESCRQMVEWRRQYSSTPLTVCVNLSARQLRHPCLAKEIAYVIEDTGMEASALQLEITESVLMDDVQATTDLLQEIKDLGVKLAVDDFGTGYSSLSYLQRFPLNDLKIDRSFIKGLDTDSEGTVIVDAVVTLAHKLGLKVVAEGIETAGQLERLRELGCDMGQGFYFSKPSTDEAISKLLKAEHPR